MGFVIILEGEINGHDQETERQSLIPTFDIRNYFAVQGDVEQK